MDRDKFSHCLSKNLLGILLTFAALPVCAHGDDAHANPNGQPGNPTKVTRTIAISMSDAMRFSPASVSVRKGDTVRFVVTNSGKVKHEWVLGSADELKEHAALMQKFPEMEHADANQLSVAPGKTGEIVWQFTDAGTVNFACLQPGHFEAGMRGTVVVK